MQQSNVPHGRLALPGMYSLHQKAGEDCTVIIDRLLASKSTLSREQMHTLNNLRQLHMVLLRDTPPESPEEVGRMLKATLDLRDTHGRLHALACSVPALNALPA